MIDLKAAVNMPEEKKEYKLIPEGEELLATIDSYEEVETRSGGLMAKVTLKVKRGEYRNYGLRERLHLKNKNPKATQIAARFLNDLLKATGEFPNGLEDIDYDTTRMQDILGADVKVVVGQKDENGYTDKFGKDIPARTVNTVKKVLPV